MIIDFSSAKGGVGKSTLSTNVAYELSKKFKVLLVDMDIGSSVDNIFYNKSKSNTIKEYIQNEVTFESLKQRITWQLDLISSPNGFWQLRENDLTRVSNEIVNQKSKYDYIIIDTAHGTSTINLEMMKISDKIIVIVNKEKQSITDNYIMIRDMRNSYNDEIKGEVYLVANKVSDEKYAQIVFNNINTQLTKRGLSNILMGAVISKSNNIEESVNNQKIFMHYYSNSAMANQIRTLIKNIGVNYGDR